MAILFLIFLMIRALVKDGLHGLKNIVIRSSYSYSDTYNKVNNRNKKNKGLNVLTINQCVFNLGKNEKFITICKNYSKSSEYSLFLLEFAIAPIKEFHFYNSETSNYKYKIPRKINENSKYLSQVKFLKDLKFLQINAVEIAYLFQTCNFTTIKNNYPNAFDNLNKIYELYQLLLSQKVLDLQDDNQFLAFLYHLYILKKEEIFNAYKQTFINLGLSEEDDINKKVRTLYENGYSRDGISTALWSEFSYKNSYVDLCYKNLKFFEDIVNAEIKEIDEKSKIEKLLYFTSTTSSKYSIEDIDLMSGVDFERFVCFLFKKFGFSTENTKLSGDQGVDVIAVKGQKKIAIQAKRYSKAVGNHAVMEAVAGAKYYGANECIVVTNNFFTKSAIELAKKNGVLLWDRNILKEKISEI